MIRMAISNYVTDDVVSIVDLTWLEMFIFEYYV